jgi:hypothetical protein
MKVNARRRVVVVLGAVFAILFAAVRSEAAPIWIEVGDAGGLTTPQFLTGGAFDEIVGSLDITDLEDVYAFHWATTTDFGAINLEPVLPDWIALSLYDFTDHVAGQLIAGSISSSGISVANLAAGDYLLRLLFVPDPGADPPYRIAISGSTANPVPSTVPEPSTLLLVASGVACCAFRRLRTAVTRVL